MLDFKIPQNFTLSLQNNEALYCGKPHYCIWCLWCYILSFVSLLSFMFFFGGGKLSMVSLDVVGSPESAKEV